MNRQQNLWGLLGLVEVSDYLESEPVVNQVGALRDPPATARSRGGGQGTAEFDQGIVRMLDRRGSKNKHGTHPRGKH